MTAIALTPEIISATSVDAGNRSMRRAGRVRWNGDNWNASVREDRRLIRIARPVLAVARAQGWEGA
jgi:hypothetical protein